MPKMIEKQISQSHAGGQKEKPAEKTMPEMMVELSAEIQGIIDKIPETAAKATDLMTSRILHDAMRDLVEARMKLCAGQDKPREGYRGLGYALRVARRGGVM